MKGEKKIMFNTRGSSAFQIQVPIGHLRNTEDDLPAGFLGESVAFGYHLLRDTGPF